MYESYMPDFEIAPKFYAEHSSADLVDLIATNAENYFNKNGVSFSCEKSSQQIEFNTPKGIFVIMLRDGYPAAVSVYSIPNPIVKDFRDSIWVTKKVFGFPVAAVLDNANDGYFETHPSRFIIAIIPKQ